MSAAPRRLLLVGLPGAGKSTVGALVGRALGWEVVDADAEVERAAGATIAEIFAREGEASFRRLESEVVERALRRERVVIAPGAGWIEGAGDPAALPPGTVMVHLRIGAAEAAARLTAEGSGRPLLREDPVARLSELERRRLPLYRRADVELAGSDEPARICARIVALVSPSSESVRD